MKQLNSCSFEIGAIRPPSEGGSNSLLLRLTRNCPWNRCKFCYGFPYRHEKFQLRSVEEIKKDIDTVKLINDEILKASIESGQEGRINMAVADLLIAREPEISYNQYFVSVFNWLASGGKSVFLQDADSLIMPAGNLIEILTYLKNAFPNIKRVTSYARTATINRKTPEELAEFKNTGLNRLHAGIETGDDELLAYIDKGVTAEQHILGGQKAKAAGIEFSTYIMPGLGGKRYSEQHAKNTAHVLNSINPDYIRSRPFVPRQTTPLFDEVKAGIFQLTSPHARLKEIQIMVESLTVSSRLCFDHMMNGWRTETGDYLFSQDFEGYKLPEEKIRVLELIQKGLYISESVHIHVNEMMTWPYL
jgi:radical SAM superfamily enzyme YgiQ (UPF0313 family)